jgi:hypothetical protein
MCASVGKRGWCLLVVIISFFASCGNEEKAWYQHNVGSYSQGAEQRGPPFVERAPLQPDDTDNPYPGRQSDGPEDVETPNPPDDPELNAPDGGSASVQDAVPSTDSIPTAKPGKSGLVESPYVPGKMVDIQGYPPGSTVRDPYTHQLFLVPMKETGQ